MAQYSEDLSRRKTVPPDELSPVPGAAAGEIVFPCEHALYKLLMLWQCGNCPRVPVRLDLCSGAKHALPLLPEELEEEAACLRRRLSDFADRRWEQVRGGASSLDAQVFVHVASGGMAAWILLLPPVGAGRENNTLQLLQLLAGCKISSGIDLELVRQLPSRPDRYFRIFPIAAGTLPAAGEDGRIIDRYPRKLKETVAAGELSGADYISLNLVQDVQPGDVICEIVPPSKGKGGSTVTGEHIPAPLGAQAAIPAGRNTAVSEDGRYLLASVAGHVEFTGRHFQVKPVLEIFDQVERTDGDVRFLGDIHIHGDVCCGATVRAMGNIQVDGVIEGCTIEAGESLVVSSGIQGQDAAVIRAHKSVYAKYLEHCTVYAHESVQADCIIDSDIYSNGFVRACTGRGAIVGGRIHAATEVVARSVGSNAEKSTVVLLGGLPCESFERSQISAELDAANREMQDLLRQPDTPAREGRLSKLKYIVCVTKLKLDRLEKEIQRHIPADPAADERRFMCRDLYPGAVVTIDHQSYRAKKVERNCAIGLRDGVIGEISCERTW